MPLYLNGTEGVYGVNGTASTPANRGSDTNTGIVYGTDTMSVVTNGVERTRVDSSGNLNFITADTGIIFNKSSALTNSTLNDYEVGTWTPTLVGSTGNPTSYTSSGYYVKVGRNVFVTFRLTLTNATGGSGVGVFGGLPFTANNNSFPAGNRNSIGVCREDAITGNGYIITIDGASTSGLIQSNSGANISWTTNYIYICTATYNSAS